MRNTTTRVRRRTRWTPLELGLITLALVLMLGSLAVEVYSWVRPPLAPAAPRLQETAAATAEPPTATATTEPPTAAATTEPPTATATTEAPTATIQPPTATSEPPTATTESPTATTEPPTVQPGTPTATPIPPLPTLVTLDPPLTLEQRASVNSAAPQEEFSFVITVASSSDQVRSVEVRNTFNGQLDVRAATSASGNCTIAQEITCVLSAWKGNPAQIEIRVRVRNDATAGALLLSQARARDDLRSTAVSDQIVVTVRGVAVLVQTSRPEASPVPPTTAAPRPTSKPVVDQPADPGGSTAPTAAIVADAPTSAPTATTEAVAEAPTTSPTPEVVAAVDNIPPTAALPPTLGPSAPTNAPQPTPVPPSHSSNVLPHTNTTAPTFGFGVGLLGLALTLHGSRRIRRANHRLSDEGERIGHLGALVDTAREFQHSTIDEIEQMRTQSAAMLELIERRRNDAD